METNEILLGLIGCAMFYSWIHFLVIQHNKNYKKRSMYEKIVTWFAILTIVLFVIGSL